jgi:trans-2,3-dihydro-3-hydroxyanthranilate isomerase
MSDAMRQYVVLDVFTSAPLEGNQLAVFNDGRGLSDALMQRAAREMNLSETVFLLPGDEQSDAHARIFTPGAELPFAGHPVLGTAFFLGEREGLETVRLRTGVGVVPVRLRRTGGQIEYGEMDQPIPTIEPFDRSEELLSALGVERSELPIEVYRNGPVYAYVALRSEDAVAALEPDTNALARFGEMGVSCFAGGDGRFKTRMFGPGLGVVEDPATGSAAGPLAVHLARHGLAEFGAEVEIRQGAEIKRPSLLLARVDGSADRIEKVVVGGSAVPVARGEYRLQ